MNKKQASMNKAPKQGTNDQGEIIQNLIDQKYDSVWEAIKWVGFDSIRDIDDRYLIFYEVVRKFNPKINNNFIHWYKTRLAYVSSYDFRGNRLVTTKKAYHNMINEYISPTGDGHGSKMVASRCNWR